MQTVSHKRIALVLLLTISACNNAQMAKISPTMRFAQRIITHDMPVIIGETKAPPKRSYDADLASIVWEYVDDAKKRGIEISPEKLNSLRVVSYVDKLSQSTHAQTIATCNRYKVAKSTIIGKNLTAWREIEVKRSAIKAYAGDNRPRLREVMYHELTHCLLDQGHSQPTKEGLMNPVFSRFNDRALTRWTSLLDQLFSRDYLDQLPNIEL